MATLEMIDTAQPIKLMAYSFERVTDKSIVDIAAKLKLPQLLNIVEPTEGADIVELADASAFIGWLRSSQWAELVEHDLQCMSEDEEGRTVLTTWISAADFEQLVSDAQTTEFGELLRHTMEVWKTLGPDQVHIEGREVCHTYGACRDANGPVMRCTCMNVLRCLDAECNAPTFDMNAANCSECGNTNLRAENAFGGTFDETRQAFICASCGGGTDSSDLFHESLSKVLQAGKHRGH